MIARNFVYNGFAIPYTPEESRIAGWYASVEWTNVTTRNKFTPCNDFHGGFYDPTYADQRMININGKIFAPDGCTRDTILFKLQKEFALETFPATDNEWKRLEFEDNCGVAYFMMCKVYTTVQLHKNEGSCDSVMNFNLTLVAKDPFIRQAVTQSTLINYSRYGGLHLGDNTAHVLSELPTELNHLAPETMIDNIGSYSAPTVFTLQGEVINPVFINHTNNLWYGLNLTLS